MARLLAECWIAPSVGVRPILTTPCANPAAGVYKTEPNRRRGTWREADQVEIAILEYVDRFN